MVSPSSCRKTRRIINEFEFDDDVDEQRVDLDDYISDDPKDAETQPGEGASVKVVSPLMTSTKPRAKRKFSSMWDHFHRVVDPKTKKTKV